MNLQIARWNPFRDMNQLPHRFENVWNDSDAGQVPRVPPVSSPRQTDDRKLGPLTERVAKDAKAPVEPERG